MTIFILRTRPDFQPLLINNLPLEHVPSYKVLGPTLCNTLKWNDDIKEIVNKASKLLYILRVLKGAGVPSSDLLNVYFALIRSVLDYFCVTWSNSLPLYLSDKIKRVAQRPWSPRIMAALLIASLRSESQRYNLRCSNNSALPKCWTERY